MSNNSNRPIPTPVPTSGQVLFRGKTLKPVMPFALKMRIFLGVGTFCFYTLESVMVWYQIDEGHFGMAAFNFMMANIMMITFGVNLYAVGNKR